MSWLRRWSDKKNIQKIFLYSFLLGIGFFILVFLITSISIGKEVNRRCELAQSQYGGDCVEALMQTLEDDKKFFRERNHAIWSLGQLGDERAIPVLEKYYTGNIPDREPYDDGLSQYEMKKALKLLNGGFNITHLLWNYR